MGTAQEIEAAIEKLPREEYLALVGWLRARDQDAWDRQFELDAEAGKLDFLLEEVEREIAAGTARPLDEILDD